MKYINDYYRKRERKKDRKKRKMVSGREKSKGMDDRWEDHALS